ADARLKGVPSSRTDLVVKPSAGAITSTVAVPSLMMLVGLVSGNGSVFGSVASGPRGSASKLELKINVPRGWIVRVKLRVTACTGALESVTRIVKLKVPGAVGVPKITPAALN